LNFCEISKMHVALIMAHPDDADIFCGGSIAAWRAMGAEVTVLIATDGSRGGDYEPEELARIRSKEAQAAASVLGVQLIKLNFEDGALSQALDFAPKLTAEVVRLRPDLLVAHAPNDYHADHRAVSTAALVAASFRAPVLWVDPMMGNDFLPNYYVDITPFQNLKEQAILCHSSQNPERFVEMSRILGRFRSTQCGQLTGFAEAFRHDPIHPYADIRALIPPAPYLQPTTIRSPS
jgi:LmbE family N-acetylglucosaminyl deacetylase